MININFKAAVLTKTNKPLNILNLSYKKLLKGQVLVKIHFSGICGSQLMEIKGDRGEDKWLPHCLGHEASGEVVACGPGAKKFKKGDKVILTWIKSCGNESSQIRFFNGKQIVNAGKITTFSNFSIVSENRIVKKPKTLSMKEAVLFGCAIPTGFGMVVNQIKPKKSMKILVLGLGGIGISTLLALKCIGHKNVFVADISKSKLDIAKKLGFKKLISGNKKSMNKIVEKMYKGFFDICIESAGSIETIELGFDAIKENGGKLFFASHPPNNEYIKIFPHDLIKGKTIQGSWGGKTIPNKDIPKMAKLIKKANIKLEQLITKTYRLENINEAIVDLKNGNIFRPVVDMDHS